jgi:hypothetical protein
MPAPQRARGHTRPRCRQRRRTMVERASRSSGGISRSCVEKNTRRPVQPVLAMERRSAGGEVGWGVDPTLPTLLQHEVAVIHWHGAGGAASCPSLSAQHRPGPAGAASAEAKGPSAARTSSAAATLAQSPELGAPVRGRFVTKPRPLLRRETCRVPRRGGKGAMVRSSRRCPSSWSRVRRDARRRRQAESL